MKNLIPVFFLTASLGAASSAAAADWTAPQGRPAAAPKVTIALPEDGPGFCVYNTAAGKLLDEKAVHAAAGAGDAVYGGETHDQLRDHLAQLEALSALYAAKGKKVAVGFEMLNMTLQPVLDEYASGAISEEEFRKKADWQKEWGFDFGLYRPLFDFIRAHKLKAVALNLPKKIVGRIARVGLAGLTPEEKKFLPAKVEVSTNAEYVNYIRQTFEGHSGKASTGRYEAFLRSYILGAAKKEGMGDMFTFENYLAAMSAWNETMGSRLADFLNANPGYAGMVVAGAGHVIYNAGIPASVASRTEGLKHVSFYPQEAAACPAALPPGDAALADNVWYISHAAGK